MEEDEPVVSRSRAPIINRPKSKTMSLLERRCSKKPPLSLLYLKNKLMSQEDSSPSSSLMTFQIEIPKKSSQIQKNESQTEFVQDIHQVPQNEQNKPEIIENTEVLKLTKSSLSIDNDTLLGSGEDHLGINQLVNEIHSGSIRLAKDIDEKDHVFSPLPESTKLALLQDRGTRKGSGSKYQGNGDIRNLGAEQKQAAIAEQQNGGFSKFYKIGKKIGEGAHSVVRECHRRVVEEKVGFFSRYTQRELVVKVMKFRDIEYLFQLLEEEKVMDEFLQHPHLVHKVEFFLEKPRKTAYLVMERVRGVNLTELLRMETRISEFESKLILSQLLKAVQFLHQKNICHRDITNNNIIYDQFRGRMKLIDFSVSKQLHKPTQKLWTNTGSVGFMAPEIFTEGSYDQTVDMWSVGVVAHSLLTGYLPFYESSDNQQQLIQSIIQGKLFLSEIGSHLSPLCKDFLERCLEKQPSKRLKPQEALSHPWMLKFEAEKLKQKLPISRPRRSLMVNSLNNIGEIAKEPKEKLNNDFECIYINRLNKELRRVKPAKD